MPQTVVQDEQGNTHIFPDGSTPEMISQALGLKPPRPPQQTPTATVSAPPKFGTLPWLKSSLYTAADKYSHLLPMMGATAGGIIGGGAGTGLTPGIGTASGAVGGAGMGGMAGSAAERLLRQTLGFDAPQDAGTQAQGIAKEGAIQGGIQAGSEALPFLAPYLKNAALSQYTKALAPTTKVNKAIAQDVAPQMIQRGLHGSLDSLEGQAADQTTQLRPQLKAAYNAMPAQLTQGSGPKILADLDAIKSKYIVNGQVANDQAVNAIDGVKQVVQRQGTDISPDSLRQLKQVFDDPVAAKGGYAGADLSTQYAAKAQKAAANSIRGIIGQASPDIAALNKEMSFWLDVQKVTGASALRQTGQAGGLVRTLSPLGMGVAGAAGLASQGAKTSVEAGALTALTTGAAIAMRSPAWRTASAVFKDRFADALARGSVSDIAELSARLGVVSPAMTQENGTTGQTIPQGQSVQ